MPQQTTPLNPLHPRVLRFGSGRAFPATYACPITRDIDVYFAVVRGREVATQISFDHVDRTRIEIVILELARNMLNHAGGGQITFACVARAAQNGLLILARDHGPGIADPELALCDGYSTTHTLGAGLPGVRRLMDEFALHSVVGVGTTVWATTWLTARRATFGRA